MRITGLYHLTIERPLLSVFLPHSVPQNAKKYTKSMIYILLAYGHKAGYLLSNLYSNDIKISIVRQEKYSCEASLTIPRIPFLLSVCIV